MIKKVTYINMYVCNKNINDNTEQRYQTENN